MRLFMLKRLNNSSKCLFSIVKLKSPINKILSYFVENAFIVLDSLLVHSFVLFDHKVVTKT